MRVRSPCWLLKTRRSRCPDYVGLPSRKRGVDVIELPILATDDPRSQDTYLLLRAVTRYVRRLKPSRRTGPTFQSMMVVQRFIRKRYSPLQSRWKRGKYK